MTYYNIFSFVSVQTYACYGQFILNIDTVRLLLMCSQCIILYHTVTFVCVALSLQMCDMVVCRDISMG